jgi:hypothetical protein
MAAIRSVVCRVVCNDGSAIRLRHAAIASVVAVAAIGAGTFLIVASHQIYEETSSRVLWALAEGARALI